MHRFFDGLAFGNLREDWGRATYAAVPALDHTWTLLARILDPRGFPLRVRIFRTLTSSRCSKQQAG